MDSQPGVVGVRIACEECQQPIDASEIDLDSVVAHCPRCDARFSIRRQLGLTPVVVPSATPQPIPFAAPGNAGSGPFIWGTPLVAPDESAIPRATVTNPGGVRVKQEGGSLNITVDRPGGCLMAGLVAGGVGMMFLTARSIMGLPIAYLGAYILFNHAGVRIMDGKLEWIDGPLPTPFSRWKLAIPVESIEQIWSHRRVAQLTGQSSTTLGYSWEVQARLKDRTSQLLLVVQDARQALFIEATIESFLGIEDRPVEGEVPRE